MRWYIVGLPWKIEITKFKLSNRKSLRVLNFGKFLVQSCVVLIVNQEMSDIDISQTAGWYWFIMWHHLHLHLHPGDNYIYNNTILQSSEAGWKWTARPELWHQSDWWSVIAPNNLPATIWSQNWYFLEIVKPYPGSFSSLSDHVLW